jgi:hypothetical protein
MDGAEGWCGERGEDARVTTDRGRDTLPAGQPGADELVSVGPVDLGARPAPEGSARLAGYGQHAAGLVDGGVTMEQFAGGSVDVIDAATQQDWSQASSGVSGVPAVVGTGGQRW